MFNQIKSINSKKWGMRRGSEDAHRATAREVRGSNPAVSTSFSLGTNEYEEVRMRGRKFGRVDSI